MLSSLLDVKEIPPMVVLSTIFGFVLRSVRLVFQ